MDATTTRALVDEAAMRSGLIWVRRAAAGTPPRPLWHVWSDGDLYVLTGAGEQPTPEGLGAAGGAEVTITSKDTRSELLRVGVDVDVLAPGTPEWLTVLPLLLATRRNLPDGDRAPERWASGCTLWRLRPAAD